MNFGWLVHAGEDRSASLVVEDDDTEELVEKITNIFKQLHINVFDNLEND